MTDGARFTYLNQAFAIAYEALQVPEHFPEARSGCSAFSNCERIGLQSTIYPQIPSSIPGGTYSDLIRMLSPTAKDFPFSCNLQKFYSQGSHKSVLACTQL